MDRGSSGWGTLCSRAGATLIASLTYRSSAPPEQTVNFVHLFPTCCVSVGFCVKYVSLQSARVPAWVRLSLGER